MIFLFYTIIGDKTNLQISNGEDCGPDNSVGKTTEMMCFPTILPVRTRSMDALPSDMVGNNKLSLT